MYGYININICIYVHLDIYIHMYTYVRVCMYVCMHVCMCIHVYIYMYILGVYMCEYVYTVQTHVSFMCTYTCYICVSTHREVIKYIHAPH